MWAIIYRRSQIILILGLALHKVCTGQKLFSILIWNLPAKYFAQPILSNFAKFAVELSHTNDNLYFHYSSSKQFFLGLSIFSRIIWDYVRHRPTKRCNNVAHKTDVCKITFVTYTWQFVPNLYSVLENIIKWYQIWQQRRGQALFWIQSVTKIDIKSLCTTWTRHELQSHGRSTVNTNPLDA